MHIKYAIVYCWVHFDREVLRVTDTLNQHYDFIHSWMKSIYHARSQEKYYDMLHQIDSKLWIHC